MIGSVTRPDNGWTAVLHEDFTWETSPDPTSAERLAFLYADFPHSPSMGRPGALMLDDLAKLVGGVVTFEPKTPNSPGTVY